MISLVIIEYFSIKEISKLIKIYRDYLGDNSELVISSNSLYPLDEQRKIEAQIPFAKWVFNEKNGGFAYGMNQGIKVAQGDIIIIANPDVRLRSSLTPMLNYLNNNPTVGLIAPKIIDKEGIIQDSFRDFISPIAFIKRQIDLFFRHGQLNVNNFTHPTQVDWVIGAFMMFRKDFYEKVGGLSEDYFMYCEDMDWCKRAHLAGYDVVYFPESVIEYKGTRASRKSWKYTKIHIKSLFTYFKKYGLG